MSTLKVGLEIHGYIDEQTKLFCDCAIDENAQPNENICPVCTGQPGSKPMATNNRALQKAVQIGLMLGCQINSRLLFQRKHYSWPDSPNNYQRTMSGSYAVPVGENGTFEGIRIREVHLEEDPAKWDPVSGKVDYNRAGCPLIEIVTEPDFTDPEQVRTWVRKLITTLSYIHALNRTAGIKSDVNVSIAPHFERVEIKNVNSQSAIVDAIIYEQKRQEKEKALAKHIAMQTRAWDDEKQETVFMRLKESADDYMFIPDPDLPYMDITAEYILQLKSLLPEPPSVKEAAFIQKGISKEDAKTICEEYSLVDLFEKLTTDLPPKLVAMYLRREIVRIANYNQKNVDEMVLDEKQIHELLRMVDKQTIPDNVAKKILEQLLITSFDVKAYVQKEGLTSVSDSGKLEDLCKKAIDANPKAVADYKAGNEKSLHFLVGQVMRETRGAAKPDVLLPILKKLID